MPVQSKMAPLGTGQPLPGDALEDLFELLTQAEVELKQKAIDELESQEQAAAGATGQPRTAYERLRKLYQDSGTEQANYIIEQEKHLNDQERAERIKGVELALRVHANRYPELYERDGPGLTRATKWTSPSFPPLLAEKHDILDRPLYIILYHWMLHQLKLWDLILPLLAMESEEALDFRLSFSQLKARAELASELQERLRKAGITDDVIALYAASPDGWRSYLGSSIHALLRLVQHGNWAVNGKVAFCMDLEGWEYANWQKIIFLIVSTRFPLGSLRCCEHFMFGLMDSTADWQLNFRPVDAPRFEASAPAEEVTSLVEQTVARITRGDLLPRRVAFTTEYHPGYEGVEKKFVQKLAPAFLSEPSSWKDGEVIVHGMNAQNATILKNAGLDNLVRGRHGRSTTPVLPPIVADAATSAQHAAEATAGHSILALALANQIAPASTSAPKRKPVSTASTSGTTKNSKKSKKSGGR